MVGESWMTTQFDKVADWARRHSFWPLPFGTACCAIEFMSTVSSHYDIAALRLRGGALLPPPVATC